MVTAENWLDAMFGRGKMTVGGDGYMPVSSKNRKVFGKSRTGSVDPPGAWGV